MPARLQLLDRPTGTVLECQEDPSLDQAVAHAHDRLAAHMAEMNASGLLLDPDALRRLRTYAADALGVALSYRRRVGPCGHGCRFPGLHCPAEERLDQVLAALHADGWTTHQHGADVQAAGAVTCVCGDPMTHAGLRRGRRRKAWAICASCQHWVTLS
jgi:hypothetical protein